MTSMPHNSTRQAFTLLELLVASAVFMIGFVAVYSMFLAGVRNRSLSDAITRSSLASTSIIAEIRMRAGREGLGAPQAPAQYEGDGFADNGVEGSGLVRYPDQTGMWYRVIDCQDLTGDSGNDRTVAMKMRIVVLHCPVPTNRLSDPSLLDLNTLKRRYRLDNGFDMEQAINHLVDRQVMQEYDTVIHRQASWMP